MSIGVQYCSEKRRRGCLARGFWRSWVFFSSRVPTSFLPDEDQGYAYVNVQLPNGASLERTTAVAADVEKIIMETPGVSVLDELRRFQLVEFRSDQLQRVLRGFQPWESVRRPSQPFQTLKANLNKKLSKVPAGVAFSFSPPAIPGLGTAGGLPSSSRTVPAPIFVPARNLAAFLEAARKRPEIASLTTTFLPRVPQDFVKVDRDKVLKQGVALDDVYRTLQCYMGGFFVNYFNRFGRQWQVYVEAEGEYRGRAETVGKYYVRNRDGDKVPFSSLTTVKPRSGPSLPCATTSTAARS